jgi:hypothetical protein
MTESATEKKVNLLGRRVRGLHISYRKTDIKITDGPFHGTEVVEGLSSQKLGLNPRPAHAKYLRG